MDRTGIALKDDRNATVHDTAAGWFARRRAGLDRQAQAAFATWIGADKAHRHAYDEIARSWDLVGGAASDPAILAMRGEALAVRPAVQARWPVRAAFGVAMAAAAAIGGFWVLTPGAPPIPGAKSVIANAAPRILRTAVGERSTFTLEDGSIVTLNTNSRVSVGFTPARRDVTLLSGTAFFQVAKNKARPFVVTAGDRQVIAVGTEFEVRIERRGVRVALLEGRVKVQPVASPATPADIALPVQAVTMLEPGEQLLADGLGQVSVQAADVKSLTTWREGRIRFDDTPLAGAVAEMNRYSRVPIVIADPRIADIRISGAFRTGQSASFVDAITGAFPIRAESDDSEIRLKSRS